MSQSFEERLEERRVWFLNRWFKSCIARTKRVDQLPLVIAVLMLVEIPALMAYLILAELVSLFVDVVCLMSTGKTAKKIAAAVKRWMTGPGAT
jgi:hypothetical protein